MRRIGNSVFYVRMPKAAKTEGMLSMVPRVQGLVVRHATKRSIPTNGKLK